jgi:hypothetical protein
LPHSTFKRFLGDLTESLVDSVMGAIRSASLEEVLGPRSAATRVGRRSRNARAATARAATTKRRPVRVRRPAEPEMPPTSVVIDDIPEPELGSEITDPERVLGVLPPEQFVDEESPSSPEVEERPSGYHVRLRGNETLARVSNAGVVIRRNR